MLRKIIFIFIVLVVALISIRVVKGRRHDGVPGPIDRAFVSGGSIAMDLSAGSYRISSTSDDHVTVKFRDESDREEGHTHVFFDSNKMPAVLEIHVPKNSSIDIGVPAKTNLQVNLTAGVVRLSGVEGSKDVMCNACSMALDIGPKEQYGPVYASIASGNLQARPWSVHKAGLMRAFSTQGPGSYGLRAHADAGNMVITSR